MPLTLSIGITEAVLEDDAVALIARADKALYQAKSDGRNCRRIVTIEDEAAKASAAQDKAPIGDMMMPPVRSSLLQ
jgi:predicted signal transduction protein with EAL and GGDEF domain